VRVDIGDGVRIWFDVEGLGLVPDADSMRERPTLVLLHGGPGMDHSAMKPAFSTMVDLCQVVYYDHRGQGRSDRRSPEEWNLDTWADDVVRFCDVLGIDEPVVLGQSFGGAVAQRYAHRHPGHASKVVLGSTTARLDVPAVVAMFGQLGGPEAARAAELYWEDPTEEHVKDFLALCGPHYTQQPGNPLDTNRVVRNRAVLQHFVRGERRTFDERPELHRVTCPVLVMAGELDPMCPISTSQEVAAALPPDLVRFERFPSCGHGVFRDDPDRAFAVLREFIAS
jgi:pimeloyl-ACP methyl ester carboxylesterase